MREVKFEYGFESVKGIVKKVYFLHELPNIEKKCDVWNVLPLLYVRQYTELKDKNNVEIYEGDILKVLVAYSNYDGLEYKRPSSVYNHETKYVNIKVSFEEGTFILDTDYTDSLDHTLWIWCQEDVEIIGTTYENKELLSHATK